jgi:hypothetical protein
MDQREKEKRKYSGIFLRVGCDYSEEVPFPLKVQIVHPEQSACDALARRFLGIADVRAIRVTFEELDAQGVWGDVV